MIAQWESDEGPLVAAIRMRSPYELTPMRVWHFYLEQKRAFIVQQRRMKAQMLLPMTRPR